MVCIRPLTGYRGPGGKVTFQRSAGFVDLPISLPCGRCVACRLERSRQWAIRCVHEAKSHDRNCFLTLTYDDRHLPEDGSVDVRTWQLFCKRLRKAMGPFRYLHCGEYGEKTFRPHYHACMFGIDFSDDRKVWREEPGRVLYCSEDLDDLWEHGKCWIGAMNFKTAAYVARYVMKKLTGEYAADEYRRIDVLTGEEYFVKPPYATMSRRPGLGREWIDEYLSEVYPDDFIVHDGGKVSPPRYYDAVLAEVDPGMAEDVKRARAKRGALVHDVFYPDRLAAKDEILRSNPASFVREPG